MSSEDEEVSDHGLQILMASTMEDDNFTKERDLIGKTRKQGCFRGCFFYCNSFGQKATNCRISMMNRSDNFQHPIKSHKQSWKKTRHRSKT